MTQMLVFPEKILKAALELSSGKDLQTVAARALDLMDKREWEKALPFCVAGFLKIQSADGLTTVGNCSYQAAVQKSSKLRVDRDCEDYCNTAINCFNFIIDGGSPTYHAFAVRSAMYLLKAQFDRAPELLDNAERDSSRAIELGSLIDDNHYFRSTTTISPASDRQLCSPCPSLKPPAGSWPGSAQG